MVSSRGGFASPKMAAAICTFMLMLTKPGQSVTQEVWFTEFAHPTKDPFTTVIDPSQNTANTVFIGIWLKCIGVLFGANDAGKIYGIWSVPATAVATLWAWKEGAVLTPPAVRAPYNFHMLWAESCMLNTEQFNYLDRCSEAYTTTKINSMMGARAIVGQNFDRPLAMIGSGFAKFVGHLPAAYGIPIVGYDTADNTLSNKYDYPTFLRTIPPAVSEFRAQLSFLSHFNYTKTDAIACDNEKNKQRVNFVKDLGLKDFGINVHTWYIQLGDHMAQPPEDELKKMYTRERDWNCTVVPGCSGQWCCLGQAFYAQRLAWAKGLVSSYDKVTKGMASLNSHVHFITGSGQECAVYDFMHVAAMKGLVGKGHLWIGHDIWITTTYNQNYLWALRNMAHGYYDYPSVFRLYRAMDAYTATTSFNKEVTEASDKFWPFWKTLQNRQAAVFGDLRHNLSADAWKRGSWWDQFRDFEFDAIWAVLLALNEVLLRTPVLANFNSTDLFETLKHLEFDGLSGRVRFDQTTLDRIQDITVMQIRTNNTPPHCWAPTIGTCAAPSAMNNASFHPLSVKTYFECLADNGMDAAPSFVSKVSTGKMKSCSRGFLGKKCKDTISDIATGLPAGTKVKELCAGRCVGDTQKCKTPPDSATATEIADYFTCIKSNCVSASDSFVLKMTSALPSCPAAVGAIAAQGAACDFNVSSMFPAPVPHNTKMYELCAEEASCLPMCKAALNSCAGPTSAAPAETMRYMGCLRTKCVDASAGFVQVMTGQAMDCPGAVSALTSQGLTCNSDLSTVMPTLPVGSFLYTLCAGQCKTQCEAANKPILCAYPANPTDPVAMGAYFMCLKTKCADAADAFVNAMAGAMGVTSCPVAITNGLSCDMDLSTVSAAVPPGTKLSEVCGEQCKTECVAANNTCTYPATQTPATMGPYFACLKNKCQDAAAPLVSVMSGGAVTECTAAVSAMAMSGVTCSSDVSVMAPTMLAPGTRLFELCGTACKEECADEVNKCPVPSDTLPASLATYSTCLQSKCQDMDASLAKTLTANVLTDCNAIDAYLTGKGLDCSSDLNSEFTLFPAGSLMQMYCRKPCKSFCANLGGMAAVTETIKAMASYAKCNANSCSDATPAVLKALLGDDITCTTLKTQYSCTQDLTGNFSRIPEGTTLASLCRKQCDCFYLHTLYEEKVVGSFALKLNLTKQVMFYDGALEAPPNLDKVCGPGKRYNTTTAECVNCDVGKYATSDTNGVCVDCQDGSWTRGPGASECELYGTLCQKKLSKVGFAFNLTVDDCALCEAGKSWGPSGCTDCAEGAFSATPGSTQCPGCDLGKFAGEGAQTVCQLCPLGRLQSDAGGTECKTCQKGKYAETLGQSECGRCDVGTYSDEREGITCKKCPGGFTTMFPTATTEKECGCGEDFYVTNVAATTCEDCPEGFTCPGGNVVTNGTVAHNMPILEAKYYAKASDPWKAFDCVEAASHCIGGGADKCSGGRYGMQCGNCDAGQTSSLDGPCEECSFSSFVSYPMVMICGVLGLAAIHKTTGGKKASIFTQLPFMAQVSQVISMVQMTALMNSYSIKWPKAVQDMFEILEIFIFDMGALSTSCYFGYGLPARYIPGVILPMLVIGTMIALYFLSRATRRWTGTGMEINNIVNTLGLVITALSVGVFKSCTCIMECRTNASADKTLMSYDGFECFGDEVMSLMPLVGFMFCFFLFGIGGTYGYVVVMGPKLFHTDAVFRRRFRFVINRWHPSYYWFGSLVVTRNLGMTLVPVVATDGMIQMVLCCFIFAPVFLTTLVVFPWRDLVANWNDVILSACVLMIMFMTGFLLETPGGGTRDAIGWTIVVTCIIATLLIAAVTIDMLMVIIRGKGLIMSKPHLDEDFVEIFVETMSKWAMMSKANSDMRGEAKKFMTQMPQVDVRRLDWVVTLMQVGMFGEKPSRTISGISPVAQRKGDERVSVMRQQHDGSFRRSIGPEEAAELAAGGGTPAQDKLPDIPGSKDQDIWC